MPRQVDHQLATHVAGHAVMAYAVSRPFDPVVVGPEDRGCDDAWVPRVDPRYYPLDLMVLAAGAVAEVQHHRASGAVVEAEPDDLYLGRLTDHYGGFTTQWTASLYCAVHTVLARPPWFLAVRSVADELVCHGVVHSRAVVAIARACAAESTRP